MIAPVEGGSVLVPRVSALLTVRRFCPAGKDEIVLNSAGSRRVLGLKRSEAEALSPAQAGPLGRAERPDPLGCAWGSCTKVVRRAGARPAGLGTGRLGNGWEIR